jgi:hypothetical protein
LELGDPAVGRQAGGSILWKNLPICRKCDRRYNVASASIPKNSNEETRSARIAIVEQHVRLENEHDLEGVLRTFGETARYDDEA